LLVIYTKSKGIEIERPKRRRKTKGGDSKDDKVKIIEILSFGCFLFESLTL